MEVGRASLSLFAIAISALLFAPSPAAAAEALPAGSNILQRVIARADFVAKTNQTNHYTYEKRSVTIELDEKGRVVKSTEKLYQVVLIGGLPFPRLVKVEGRDLTARELEK